MFGEFFRVIRVPRDGLRPTVTLAPASLRSARGSWGASRQPRKMWFRGVHWEQCLGCRRFESGAGQMIRLGGGMEVRGAWRGLRPMITLAQASLRSARGS
jgi:hypothetical protein